MTMKISDEIRDWCDDAYSGRKIRSTNDLYVIADRIDSEMVELPKDADGVPIHVGDKVYLDDGHVEKVTCIGLMSTKAIITCWIGGGEPVEYMPSGITHTRPDSWERIADDLDEIVDAACSEDDSCEKLADLADRIRRLAEKDGKR